MRKILTTIKNFPSLQDLAKKNPPLSQIKITKKKTKIYQTPPLHKINKPLLYYKHHLHLKITKTNIFFSWHNPKKIPSKIKEIPLANLIWLNKMKILNLNSSHPKTTLIIMLLRINLLNFSINISKSSETKKKLLHFFKKSFKDSKINPWQNKAPINLTILKYFNKFTNSFINRHKISSTFIFLSIKWFKKR